MRLSRRNTIVGLGTLAVGAGIIGGSGAFDTVEAQRSFEVEVASDSDALLGLEVLNEVIAGMEEGGAGDSDIIFFALDDDEVDGAGINENAVTDFFSVFRITNNGSQEVQIRMEYGDADGLSFIVTESRDDNSDIVDSDVNLEDGVDLEVGQSIVVDISIDTTPEGGYTELDDPYDLTLFAESEAAQNE